MVSQVGAFRPIRRHCVVDSKDGYVRMLASGRQVGETGGNGEVCIHNSDEHGQNGGL